MVQGPRNRVNIVQRYLEGFCSFGRVRFRRLLTFHLYFHSQNPLQAPNLTVFGDKCGVLSMKELSYDLVVLIKVRRDLSVSV